MKWWDAHSPKPTDAVDMDNPDALKGIHEAATIITRGWILQSDGEGVTMAGEDAGENVFRTLTFIPRCLIQNETKPRRKRASTASHVSERSPQLYAAVELENSAPSVQTGGDPSSNPSND